MHALFAFLLLMQAPTLTDTPAPAVTEQTTPAPSPEAQPTPDAAAQAAANPNERVCIRERVTGSNIPRRVCRTRAEMEALAEQSGEAMRRSGASISDDAAARPRGP
jgi:hypothetical protein